MADNINLADPGAEQPTITLADGREITVLTDGTMPHAKSLLAKRLIVRAANIEQRMIKIVEDSIPDDIEADIEDADDTLDALQSELDKVNGRATRLICPELRDGDMDAFSREVHGVIHARFLLSAGQLMRNLNQTIEGTSE